MLMDRWDSLIAAAEVMVRRVLPEYTRPVYVVPCAGTVFAGMASLGATSPNMDLMVRVHVSDRWQGRGLGVLVNTDLIKDERAFLAIVIHETAHAVSDGWLFGPRPHVPAGYA